MTTTSRDPQGGMPIYPGMRGKVALVTGGSSGIGLATASAFARQGARVMIASRGEATAKAALKRLTAEGEVQWHPVDVADSKSVLRMIEVVTKVHGRLDYAFNNGGKAVGALLRLQDVGGRMAQDHRRLSNIGFPLHERGDSGDEKVGYGCDR